MNNDNMNNNWNNKKKLNYKKTILLLLIILLCCICLGVLYQKFTTHKSNMTDEEYIKAKEEFQRELEEKRQNYSFYEKLIYGEKINIAIINSSLRNENIGTAYPFNSLYTYIKKYNSSSNIYEFSSNKLSTLTDSINKNNDNRNDDNKNKDNPSYIKSCDMYIISINETTENYDIETYDNLIDSILSLNNKNIIFIAVESGNNESKINKIKSLSNKDNTYYIDMRQTLLDSHNNDINIIKNNNATETKESISYCKLIIDKIEDLK